MKKLFLGLDCSTQSLSAIVIDDNLKKAIYETSINYDRDLPHYQTVSGCLPSADPSKKQSSPLLWAEALDFLFERMKDDGVALDQIKAISGSGQQHGTVYLNADGVLALSTLDSSKSLRENLIKGFSRQSSPIWMDSSTAEECRELHDLLGGPQIVRQVTGSQAFERFSAAQIRKFYKTEQKDYESTQTITLVSAYMASLLSGKIAPIDHCDGSGMNLMDIRQKTWHREALEASAPDLIDKLPSLEAPWTIIGFISRYFVHKYGLDSNTLCVVWSGDNPNSLVGLGVTGSDKAAVSLGTSFTYFGFMDEYSPNSTGEGHIFASPKGAYMSLICFKNGSLAIEKIRNQFSLSWNEFSDCLEKTTPGNRGKILLPYFEDEITPQIRSAGIRSYGLEPTDGPGYCRAVIEAQMMSMRLHSAWMPFRPQQIYATGGASINLPILQIMADTFGCPIQRLSVSNSAALGAALRAAYANNLFIGVSTSFEETISEHIDGYLERIIDPIMENVVIYDELLVTYADAEKENRVKSYTSS